MSTAESPASFNGGCPGCAATTCPCGRNSGPASRRPETLRAARQWQTVKEHYLTDGFCHPCAAQAAYGHQMGFSKVLPVCAGCRGLVPTYRGGGMHATAWAGVSG